MRLDAAILFSDILTIPDAMGLGLSFGAGEGPKFAHPIENKSAVENFTHSMTLKANFNMWWMLFAQFVAN